MDELITWLRAQLDEDDRVAHAANLAMSDSGEWDVLGLSDPRVLPSVQAGNAIVARDLADEDAVHIARWDPARVLAEVEAKRRILDEAIRLMGYDGEFEFLELLAQPYAGREGWREEWATPREG